MNDTIQPIALHRCTPEQATAATRTIAEHAVDAADARLLLDQLGLTGGAE